MSKGYLKAYIDRELILEKCSEELIHKIKKVTGLTIPTEPFANNQELSNFLEEFIQLNKLFDFESVWKKYEKDYLMAWREMIEDLPASESINKLKNKIDKMVKNAGRGD